MEQTDAGRDRLLKFRQRVCTGRMVNFYNNANELKAKVATSINRCIRDFPAIGWIRSDSLTKNNNFQEQISNYLEKHTISADEINTLFDSSKIVKNTQSIHTKAIPEQYKNTANQGVLLLIIQTITVNL